MKNFYPVIMAGGRGGRFWPMGRKKNPKQLLPLTGERSMLRETVDRLEGLAEKDHILIMTNRVRQNGRKQPLPADGAGTRNRRHV